MKEGLKKKIWTHPAQEVKMKIMRFENMFLKIKGSYVCR